MLLKKRGSNDKIVRSTCAALAPAAFLAESTKAVHAATWAVTRVRQSSMYPFG